MTTSINERWSVGADLLVPPNANDGCVDSTVEAATVTMTSAGTVYLSAWQWESSCCQGYKSDSVDMKLGWLLQILRLLISKPHPHFILSSGVGGVILNVLHALTNKFLHLWKMWVKWIKASIMICLYFCSSEKKGKRETF